MIPTPLGLRLDPSRPVREQVREAARLGARGVVLDATGDLAPQRLSETGRRELRHLLRSVEVSLIALNLPTRRPFDTVDQLDDRLRRAESAFAMGYELGATLVLARVGGLPPESDAQARGTFLGAVAELGRRADHRGVRLAVETGPDGGETVKGFLDAVGSVGLAASVDPGELIRHGHDPVASARELGPWIAHAYATDDTPRGRRGGLDWEAYLGALEEVNYRGFLTVWPDPARDPGPQFAAIADRLNAL
jgi:L-ribulose-5-phosphate 3-epimerase